MSSPKVQITTQSGTSILDSLSDAGTTSMSRCCSSRTTLFRLLVFAESDLTGTTHGARDQSVDEAGHHENACTMWHARQV